MKRGSLRLRLLTAGAISVLIALAFAALGLQVLFERHVERRIAIELDSLLRQLVSSVSGSPDGTLALAHALADPRFAEPLSGLYWQISPENRKSPPLRSRSLWETSLALPAGGIGDGEVHHHTIAGPDGQSLFAAERALAMPPRMGGGRIRAVVAINRAELTQASRAFGYDLLPYLAVLAMALIAAAWLQVSVGLRPLQAVSRRIADVRAGIARQLGSDFPDEVLPLATEVDLLLEAQDRAIERARARAADLAHVLRTPLTVLKGAADDLARRGERALAGEIANVADAMRRSVDRELARARAGGRASAAKQRLRPIIEQVVSVLGRLPAAQVLDLEIDAQDDLSANVDGQDLAEILGNLGENAVRWARHRVRFGASARGTEIRLIVEDDGPGIPESAIECAMRRGGRLPQSHEGSGLGLSIVSELAQTYGGVLQLARSELGGLRAEIVLPILPPNSVQARA
jgi:signal transduction histidine kinase